MRHTCKVRCRAIITDEDALLIVKNSRGSDYYALPGGHLDPGEDPVECITREIEEELGVVPEIERLLFVYTFTDGEGQQSVEFFFEVVNGNEFRSHEEKEKTHAHELSEVRWIKKGESINLLPPEVKRRFDEGILLSETPVFIKGEPC